MLINPSSDCVLYYCIKTCFDRKLYPNNVVYAKKMWGRGYNLSIARSRDMETALVFLLLFAIPGCCYSQSNRFLQTYPPYDDADPRTPLTFALLQSFGGDFNSSGAVAGVQVALDVINNDTTLLPGYTLHYTLTDSQVSTHAHVCDHDSPRLTMFGRNIVSLV